MKNSKTTKVFRRISGFISAVAMTLTLCGCESTEEKNYKQAMIYMQEGNYTQAKAILNTISYYEDSAEKLKDCCWYELSTYFQQTNVISITDTSDYGEVAKMVTTNEVTSSDKNTICIKICKESSGFFSSENTFKVTLRKDSDICTFTVDVSGWLGEAKILTTGEGEFSKSEYNSDNSFSFSSLDSNLPTSGVLTVDNDPTSRIIECMTFLADSVNDSGLGLDMNDLGFVNY